MKLEKLMKGILCSGSLILILMNSAKSTYAEEWTLGRIQTRALEVSPMVQALLKDQQASQLEEASPLPNPGLVFQTGQLQSGSSTGSVLDFFLSQSIPFPGKLSYRTRWKELQTQIAKLDFEEAKLSIQHAATVSAIRLAMLKEVSYHSDERRKRFQLIQKYLKTHPQASPTHKVEFSLIESQMRLLEKGMLELSTQVQVARLELNFLLQRKEGVDPPIEPQIKWIDSMRLPDKQKLFSRLYDENPTLRKSGFSVHQAEVGLSRARIDPWPDFFLALNYRVENVMPSNHFYQASLGINIPLFDRGQFTILAAKARLESEELRKAYLKLDVEKKFQEYWSQVESSSKILSYFPLKLIEDSEKSFNRAEAEFRKGRINVSIFLQTDAQIHETLDSVYQVQLSFIESLSRLFMLVGLPLQWENN